MVERALGAGHPLTVVTDGELDDPDAARGARRPARASSCVRTRRSATSAVASIDVPRAVVSGDTVEARVGVVAGNGGARAARSTLTLDGRPVATAAVDSLPPFGERTVVVRARLEGAPGPAVLRAVVASRGRRRAAQRHADRRRRSVARGERGVRVDVARLRRALCARRAARRARYSDARIFSRGSGGVARRRRAHAHSRGGSAPGGARRAGRDHPRRHGGVRPAAQRRRSGRSRSSSRPATDGEWYPSAAPAVAARAGAVRLRVGQSAAGRRRVDRSARARGRAGSAARPRRRAQADRRRHRRAAPRRDRRRVGPVALALSRRRRVRRVHGALGKHLRLAGRRAGGSPRRGARRAARSRRRSGPLAARHRQATRWWPSRCITAVRLAWIR